MKAFKFIRGLFGKKERKDRREEEIRKEKMRTERENQLFNLIEEIEEEFQRFEEKNRRKELDRRKEKARRKMEMEMEEERKKKKKKKESFMLSVSSLRGEGTSFTLVPKW